MILVRISSSIYDFFFSKIYFEDLLFNELNDFFYYLRCDDCIIHEMKSFWNVSLLFYYKNIFYPLVDSFMDFYYFYLNSQKSQKIIYNLKYYLFNIIVTTKMYSQFYEISSLSIVFKLILSFLLKLKLSYLRLFSEILELDLFYLLI